LHRTYPTVVEGYTAVYRPLAFTPDSRSLVTGWSDLRFLRLWPVGEDMRRGHRVLELPERDNWLDVTVDPRGHFLIVVGFFGSTHLVPLDGAAARRLEGFSNDTSLWTAAVSPSGRRAAAAFGMGDGEKALRVWDVDSGEPRRFDLPERSRAPTLEEDPTSGRSHREQAVRGVGFVGESTLYTGGDGGIHRWNLESGTHELVFAAPTGYGLTMRLGAEGRTALVRHWPLTGQECLPAELVDVEAGTARELPAFGECVYFDALALDASGTVAVTGDRDGLVRVGRLGQGEPHLLAGHSGTVRRVAISPDLRWVASAGEDNTLRLWPMPDLDRPPLHTLPHDELIAKLRSLTNLRAVPDPEAPNGWSIELDAFPGWKDAPAW
jgi:WD40 repeat protein